MSDRQCVALLRQPFSPYNKADGAAGWRHDQATNWPCDHRDRGGHADQKVMFNGPTSGHDCSTGPCCASVKDPLGKTLVALPPLVLAVGIAVPSPPVSPWVMLMPALAACIVIDAPRWQLPRLRWGMFAALFWPFALPDYLSQRQARGADTPFSWGVGGVVLAVAIGVAPYLTDGMPQVLRPERHLLINVTERCGRVSLGGFDGHWTLLRDGSAARICQGRIRWRRELKDAEYPWTEEELCFGALWPAEGGMVGQAVHHRDVFQPGTASLLELLLKQTGDTLVVSLRKKGGQRPTLLELQRNDDTTEVPEDTCAFYNRKARKNWD